jgi:hypothetical protein
MTKEQILAEIKKVENNQFRPDVVKKIKIKKLNEELINIDKNKISNPDDKVVEEIDLFEHPEKLPKQVQAVLNKYSEDDNTYESLGKMLSEMKPLGYTFEYGLDAVPYDLKKIKSNSKPQPKRVKKSSEEVKINKVKTKKTPFKFRKGTKVHSSYFNSDGIVESYKFNKEFNEWQYLVKLNNGKKELILEPGLRLIPKTNNQKPIGKFKGKNLNELTDMECEELRKSIKERRQKAAKSEKKSKSKPVIEKIASNVAMAVKQAVQNVSAKDIKDDPKKEIKRFELIEKAAKSFLSEMRGILGEDYDKESINDEFSDIHNLIKELKKKYNK